MAFQIDFRRKPPFFHATFRINANQITQIALYSIARRRDDEQPFFIVLFCTQPAAFQYLLLLPILPASSALRPCAADPPAPAARN